MSHVIRDQPQSFGAFAGPRSRCTLCLNAGLGFCNITKCCTEVCPEHIKITDNAIIPLKERVVDEYYDPVLWLVRKLTGRK